MSKPYVWIVLSVLLAGLPAAGTAITLNLLPSAATVTAGDMIDVDVLVSGLGAGAPPSVGAFDLDVAFDPVIFTPVDVVFGPFLGDPLLLEALTDFSFAVAGIVDFAEVSLLSAAALDALQPASFVLATLSFAAQADGSGAFRLVGDRRVDDPFGNKLAVPVPVAAALLGAGLLALAGVRRRAGGTGPGKAPG
ncbi:MAG: cohesin domain-containing protein [Pseudomonadota bacterium]|nr:cohesin domain-containing protein [Pseudomonadota bacterium]